MPQLKQRSLSRYGFQRRLRSERLEGRRMMHADPLDDDSFHATPVADLLPDVFNFAAGDSSPGGAGSSATFSLASIPALSSLPGAAATLYLDFDGHFESTWGGYGNLTTPVFDQDGDLTTFSANELDAITNIWARVAEDYAPFKINVTTVAPPSFADRVALRVSIGGGGSWMGGTYGGVAYVDSFTNWIANTAYVFSDNLARGNSRYTAEAVSHEAGHAFGLNHQSQYNSAGQLLASYYGGPGDGRAPIMGVSYYATRGLWWNGTTTSASTTQDDMSVIAKTANGFGYRADDHGNTADTATAVTVSGNQISGAGIIGSTSDVDYFSFTTGAGQIQLNVSVPANINNLDARLELRDAAGSLVAALSPSDSFGASLTTTVAAGSYRLVVASSGGYGNVGQYTVSGTIVPVVGFVAAPTSLTAALANGRMNLAWKDNSTNETAYYVDRSVDGGSWTTIATLNAGATSFADTGLVAGGVHVYRVWAANSTSASAYSNQPSVALAPAAPSGLTASAMAWNTVTLNWNDVNGETGYRIERSTNGGKAWSVLANVGGGVTSYQNTGLSAKISYAYRVVAVNSVGSSAASNVASLVTPAKPIAPAAPTNLAAKAISHTQVNLTWKDGSNNETGFRIERSTNGGKSYGEIATVGAGATSFADTSVGAQMNYVYRVRAYNEVGNSAFTAAVKVTTPKAPPAPVAAPTNLAATVTPSNRVNLAWQDNSTNETAFRVERSLNGGASWTQIGTVSPNVTTFTDSTAVKGRAYVYRVRGYGDAGNTAYTNTVQTVIAAAPARSEAVVQSTSVPRMVFLASSLNQAKAAALASSFADLSWVDSLSG